MRARFALILCLLAASAGAEPLRITTATGVVHTFEVEVARTPQEMAQGLMYRTEMAPDAGMLFALSEEQPDIAFWMKDTYIPLDMLFIRPDGTIAKIHDSAKPLDLTQIHANEPVIGVLELNGGRAKALGIAVNDRISLGQTENNEVPAPTALAP